MFKTKLQAALSAPSGSPSDDAVFVGWQGMKSGEVFALYNIVAVDHPSYGSTVTQKSLRRLNLRIPWTPVPRGPEKKF